MAPVLSKLATATEYENESTRKENHGGESINPSASVAQNRKQIAVRKKKKNPQTKIKHFFASTKSLPRRPSMNFQGFPIQQCVYEPTLCKWLFHPRGWGTKLPFPFTKASWLLCKDCLLKPCFAAEKHVEIFGFLDESNDSADSVVVSFSSANQQLRIRAMESMCQVFGRRYAHQTGLPKCVLDDIDGRFPLWWDDVSSSTKQWEDTKKEPDSNNSDTEGVGVI